VGGRRGQQIFQINRPTSEQLFAVTVSGGSIQLFEFPFSEIIRLHDPLGNDKGNGNPNCKNSKNYGHNSGTFPGLDASGKNDHSHSHPEAENAGHPDADENTVVMAYEKPK
jgi:hypothetical protein